MKTLNNVRPIILFLITVLSTSCYSYAVVPRGAQASEARTGGTEQERLLKAAESSVRNRAVFDLGCNNPKLVHLSQLEWFGRTEDGSSVYKGVIGAICDDSRASYVANCIMSIELFRGRTFICVAE